MHPSISQNPQQFLHQKFQRNIRSFLHLKEEQKHNQKQNENIQTVSTNSFRKEKRQKRQRTQIQQKTTNIKSIAKAAVDHQRHGDYGDADALQKATKAVKKATRYPGRKGPKVTPSLPESYDELNERIDSEGRYIRDSKPNGGSRIITPTSSTSATKPTKPTKATATKPTKTTSYGMEEEFDLYDVVLDHLLDEGYANGTKAKNSKIQEHKKYLIT